MKLDERHMTAMTRLLEGRSRKDIAHELDVHETTITLWQRQPEFQSELQRLRDELSTTVRDIIGGRLAEEAGPSLDKIVTLRDSARHEGVQLKASQDILDRAGFKAVDRSVAVHAHILSPEFAELLKGVMREDDQVFDAEYEGVSELPERSS